jgi:serine/threonine-protein kinase RIM15
VRDLRPEHKRRSQVFDNVSPSSSDNEDTRQKALLRVQRRRQSSRRLSQITLAEGPMYRPLDVLICDDHPVSRLVLEKLLERLRCRSLASVNGTEASRYAMSEVKFDIIFTEFKLPVLNGADLARMIRKTKNINAHTPIVAVTGYLKELPPNHFFDGLIDKPPTIQKLTDILGRLCQWRPPPPTAHALPWQAPTAFSHLRHSALLHADDSPTSLSSGFAVPSSSYRGSSRTDSISSSFFGDNDSRSGEPVTQPLVIDSASKNSAISEWQDKDLARNFEGLGIMDFSPTDSVLEGKGATPPFPSLDHSISEPIDPSKLAQHLSPQANTLRKKRSLESRRLRASTTSPESADDEDDELGGTGSAAIRAKSPRNRPRGSSKLGTEMLRTNSRGSVVSVEDIPASSPYSQGIQAPTSLPVVQDIELADIESLDFQTPTASIGLEGFKKMELSSLEELETPTTERLTPPIGDQTVDSLSDEIKDMDITPRPAAHLGPGEIRDPDPTPRPASSRMNSNANLKHE